MDDFFSIALDRIDPAEFSQDDMQEWQIRNWLKVCNAYWAHDGDPKKPHVEFVSGLCSNRYINCRMVTRHPNLNGILAMQLVKKLRAEGYIDDSFTRGVNRVIGSSYSAITISYEVAWQLAIIHEFAERDPSDPTGRKMLWTGERITSDCRVLQIEDIVTTGHTWREVRRAVTQGNVGNVDFFPVVGALFHAPPRLPIDNNEVKIVALIEEEAWTAKPEDCPLCRAGSPRLRPKTHWAELTERY